VGQDILADITPAESIIAPYVWNVIPAVLVLINHQMKIWETTVLNPVAILDYVMEAVPANIRILTRIYGMLVI
jgi:hypothetical protein